MVDLKPLDGTSRLLFTIPLQPVQGDRFQPTGFPGLGAATYQSASGSKLLVESAQSMANRLEKVLWDDANNQPIPALKDISHITVQRKGAFLTDSMLEAHRINSPYILEGSDKTFFKQLKADLGGLEEGPIDRRLLAKILLKYDIGSLIHGVFLAKKDLAGGRLRLARALSAFIEATGTQVAASGGVKNDHVNPSGVTKDRFGNVPFARDEFTAERIDLHVNLDLAQIRGYGLDEQAQRLLILLALYKLRRLLDDDLRLRTACDLVPQSSDILASRPDNYRLPEATSLEAALPEAIKACAEHMQHSTVAFDDALKKGKNEDDADTDNDSDQE